MQGWPNIVQWIIILLGKLHIIWGIPYSIMENRWSCYGNIASCRTSGVSLLLVTQSTSSSFSLLSLPLSSPFFNSNRTYNLLIEKKKYKNATCEGPKQNSHKTKSIARKIKFFSKGKLFNRVNYIWPNKTHLMNTQISYTTCTTISLSKNKRHHKIQWICVRNNSSSNSSSSTAQWKDP